ncbi:GPP34 family phosphoprotein [Sporichthya sp.]|uniref:GPP34 family phosphoprotein n=1 Tax=Sporichthya sp. TaxID=65475 RepID=UPI0017DD5B10|nr:GPP34 family phosphoprotein [Sporichthya sp.]
MSDQAQELSLSDDVALLVFGGATKRVISTGRARDSVLTAASMLELVFARRVVLQAAGNGRRAFTARGRPMTGRSQVDRTWRHVASRSPTGFELLTCVPPGVSRTLRRSLVARGLLTESLMKVVGRPALPTSAGIARACWVAQGAWEALDAAEPQPDRLALIIGLLTAGGCLEVLVPEGSGVEGHTDRQSRAAGLASGLWADHEIRDEVRAVMRSLSGAVELNLEARYASATVPW